MAVEAVLLEHRTDVVQEVDAMGLVDGEGD
jgi:hypothetical protein